jgi:hypothetical protein
MLRAVLAKGHAATDAAGSCCRAGATLVAQSKLDAMIEKYRARSESWGQRRRSTSVGLRPIMFAR